MMKKEKVTYVTYDQETHSLNRMLNNAGQKYQIYICSSTFKPIKSIIFFNFTIILVGHYVTSVTSVSTVITVA